MTSTVHVVKYFTLERTRRVHIKHVLLTKKVTERIVTHHNVVRKTQYYI